MEVEILPWKQNMIHGRNGSIRSFRGSKQTSMEAKHTLMEATYLLWRRYKKHFHRSTNTPMKVKTLPWKQQTFTEVTRCSDESIQTSMEATRLRPWKKNRFHKSKWSSNGSNTALFGSITFFSTFSFMKLMEAGGCLGSRRPLVEANHSFCRACLWKLKLQLVKVGKSSSTSTHSGRFHRLHESKFTSRHLASIYLRGDFCSLPWKYVLTVQGSKTWASIQAHFTSAEIGLMNYFSGSKFHFHGSIWWVPWKQIQTGKYNGVPCEYRHGIRNVILYFSEAN